MSLATFTGAAKSASSASVGFGKSLPLSHR
jgi:hypothetical protein